MFYKKKIIFLIVLSLLLLGFSACKKDNKIEEALIQDNKIEKDIEKDISQDNDESDDEKADETIDDKEEPNLEEGEDPDIEDEDEDLDIEDEEEADIEEQDGEEVDIEEQDGEEVDEEETDEKKTDKEEGKKEEKKPITETIVDYSKFNNEQIIDFKKDFLVYETELDAKNRVNSKLAYPAGRYYIYKVAKKAINVARSKNNPGGWVDLAFIGEDNFNISKDLVIEEVDKKEDDSKSTGEEDKSNEIDLSSASTKGYNWSWGYPETSGKSVLENNRGIYKKYNVGKTIYLTFDNGYEYRNLTDTILEKLAKNNVKAVFFTTGTYIESNPGLVKKMVEGGHLVGNHSYYHKNHSKVSASEVREDLIKWEEVYTKHIGALPKTKLYRPPEGSFSESSLLIAKDLGYTSVLWAYAYNDWNTSNQPDVSSSLKGLLKNNNGGNIVLLHAVSETNVSLLDDYINESRKAGYEFKLID